MADVEHSALTGAALHEPKGADTASANTAYISNGAGSGIWQKIASSQIDTTSIFNINKAYLTVSIVDVSTPETVYLYVPFNGTLNKVSSVLQNAITVADSLITVKDHSGATAGTFTITQSGSAAGDIDGVTTTSNNTFTNGQRVSVSTDGNSTTAARLFLTLEFTITG
jgi:hypothetical protein